MTLDQLRSLASTDVDFLWAALISAVVSAAVSYFFRRRETRHRLKTEYEYEQRKKLRELIGRYHGRLLNATNSLNYRFLNLYANHEKDWLRVAGNYDPDSYYFHSFVHRFLSVCSLIRQFEREAIFVDARIAEKRDFLFLKYLGALQWCMTDVALFRGLDYDSFDQRDHFFADTFRQYCDSCILESGAFIAFDDFVVRIQEDRSLDSVLDFFDSLSRSEERLRWDRLVSFHLLLVGFINEFGYREQRTSQQQLDRIARQALRPGVLQNLVAWLPRHGLVRNRSVKMITRACMSAGAA